MLYLFNSAYRPLYRVNVLNTLYLPPGSRNSYRYDMKHVALDLRTDPSSLAPDERAVVIFVDRHGPDGFRFVPLRRGLFVKVWTADRRHFEVEFDDFIFAEVTDFGRRLAEAFPNLIPRMVDGCPEEEAQGYFAFHAEKDVVGLCEKGNKTWRKTVDSVSATKIFSDPPNDRVLFMRATIDSAKSGSTPSVVDGMHLLKKGTDYCLRLTYVFPSQQADRDAVGQLDVKFPSNLLPIGSTKFAINGHADELQLRFHADALSHCAIELAFTATGSTGKAVQHVVTDHSIYLKVERTRWYWFAVVGAALVYAFTVWIGSTLGFLFPTGASPHITQVSDVCASLREHWVEAGLKAIIAIFQTGALLALFFLFGGKKPV